MIKKAVAIVLFMALSAHVLGRDLALGTDRPTKSQIKEIMKDWALSSCISEVSKDKADKDDAGLSAYAYFERGRMGVEDTEALGKLVSHFAARKYGGAVSGEYNIMKCIDLYRSKDLDVLVTRLLRSQ